MSSDSQEQRINPQFPSLETVSGIYTEVLAHNRENTGVGALFKAMVGNLVTVETPDEESDGITNQVNLQEAVSADTTEALAGTDLAGDLVTFSADSSMSAIGLRLAPKDDVIVDGRTGGRASTAELKPFLDSPTKFAGFMGSLDVDTAKQDTSFRRLAGDVLAELVGDVKSMNTVAAEQLLDSAESDMSGQATEVSLQAFATIMSDYERLGLAETAEFEQMSAYVQRWGEGVLSEYLFVEQKAYLKPDIQGFGPASWQKDPNGLKDRWDEALGFVAVLGQDPRTAQLGHEVSAALEAALDKAIVWSDDPANSIGRPFMDDVRATLAEVARQFEDAANEKETLDHLAEALGAPSIESQKDTLEQLKRRYYVEWQDTGMLAKIVDAMHIDDGERSILLERVLSKGADGSTSTEEHFFRVNYADSDTVGAVTSTRLSNSHVPVSRSVDGIIEPLAPFDASDAALVARQVAELLEMKEAGLLPNLSGNLSSIVDPSTMLSIKSPEQD